MAGSGSSVPKIGWKVPELDVTGTANKVTLPLSLSQKITNQHCGPGRWRWPEGVAQRPNKFMVARRSTAQQIAYFEQRNFLYKFN